MATPVLEQAKELYRSGRLGEAIDSVVAGVKASPSDGPLRTFLFELVCFAGDWERAERQLDVLGHQNTSAEMGVQVYRNCIKAEIARRHLLRDGLQPHFLSEPPEYIDRQLDAMSMLRAGDISGASVTFREVEEARPALSGVFNGQPFDDFRDSDDLCGPALELIVQDKYTWLPFEQIKRFEIDTPTQLRDLIWSPASIETHERELRAFVPNLYVASASETDDNIRLGRVTEWREIGEGLFQGVGLRLFLVAGLAGKEEQPVFNARGVSFNSDEAGRSDRANDKDTPSEQA